MLDDGPEKNPADDIMGDMDDVNLLDGTDLNSGKPKRQFNDNNDRGFAGRGGRGGRGGF